MAVAPPTIITLLEAFTVVLYMTYQAKEIYHYICNPYVYYVTLFNLSRTYASN